jgi:cell wall-associated NlpC family hydrolase
VRALFVLVLTVTFSGVVVFGSGAVAEAKPVRLQDPSIAEMANEALEALAAWRQDESPAHYVTYLEGRDLVARQISTELSVEGTDLEQAWRELPMVRQVVALTAVAQVGIKYRYLGKDPAEGFDCSGLTGFAWSTAGQFIGHNSRGQYLAGNKITAEQAQAGDLIWYPGHIMLYLGASNIVVHAPFTGRNVEIRQMVPSRTRTAKYSSPI